MLDHVTLAVSDFPKARDFYDTALAPLGVTRLYGDGAHFAGYGEVPRAYFWIGLRAGATSAAHVAFAATSRAEVDAFYRAAMAAGGRDNGAPGIRAQYAPTYYGAFVLDPDGNNIEAVCHAA